ncbi:uncharacterized protein PV09_04127 [Verruconis gallopava]|uniref:Uncharacterized protein n=1 Tax=Verruconis gallopava TaxID=253628 RepID=A0A0D2B0W0_9PEZI|nr:uncharacterized protein PV09_04127 [Verruconis gallopava]KIW04964.1 hypothetical protein PV09_04127 [Verruconis gallopava]
MAPTPDENHGFGYDSDYPPQGITPEIPSVTTTTYIIDKAYTTTVAFFINSWIDYGGNPHTYTITQFDNLADASSMAVKIAEALQSIEQGLIQSAAVQSQYSTYGATHATTSSTYSTPAAPASTPSTVQQTAPVTGTPLNEEQQQQQQSSHHGPPVTALALGIIVPIIVCILTITSCVLCVSHYRRKARRAQAEGRAARAASEMRQVGPGSPKPASAAVVADERAYHAPPDALAAIPSSSHVAGALGQEPPVILSTTMNNTYFTGIDTSDQVSLSDQRSVASHDTFGEEPPPPYRPRSVPPISRETSVRTSITSTPYRMSSTRSRCETLSSASAVRRSNEVRSPFDDPEEAEEDEHASEASTLRGGARMSTDRLSEASDLSYQEDPRPTASHSHV